MRTLKLHGYPDLQGRQTNALNYLQSDSYGSSEHLTRKILALSAAGGDVSPLSGELLARVGRDDGFGELAGYPSTVLDTVFVLEAMAHAGQRSSDTAAYAAGFLLSWQRSDGENSSSIYLTALASSTLHYYRNLFDLAEPIGRANAYLISRRDDNGAIGELFETALAL